MSTNLRLLIILEKKIKIILYKFVKSSYCNTQSFSPFVNNIFLAHSFNGMSWYISTKIDPKTINKDLPTFLFPR